MTFWGDKHITVTIMKLGDVVRIVPNPGRTIEVCGDNFWRNVVKFFSMDWVTQNKIEQGYAVQFKVQEKYWDRFIQHPLR